MEQVFVTPTGELKDRWVKAFPNACVVTTSADIPAASAAPKGVVWLDICLLYTSDAADD